MQLLGYTERGSEGSDTFTCGAHPQGAGQSLVISLQISVPVDDSGSTNELKVKHHPDVSQLDLSGLYATWSKGRKFSPKVWVSHPACSFLAGVGVILVEEVHPSANRNSARREL